MGKRKSAAALPATRGGGGGSPAAASSKKGKGSIAAMLTARAAQGPEQQPAERLELPAPPAPQLSAELKHRIETDVERYKKKWSEWCTHQEQQRRRQSSSLAPGSAGGHHHGQEERTELDALAMQLLDAIGRVQSHARGAALDEPTLEALVLVCRNDACHSHPNLSRQAFTLLMAQLATHPVAQPGAGPGGAPCLLRDDEAAWVPLTSDLGSFTAKYLLLPDITVAGCNFRMAEVKAQGRPDERDRFRSAHEMLACLFQRAAESDETDWNGDLLLLRYLLAVYHQDLRARLAVYSASAALPARSTLLRNSLLWRTCGDQMVSADDRRRLVHLLVQLIVARGSEAELMAVEAGSDSEGEEDPLLATARRRREAEDAAAPCAFTRRELAAQAALLLRMQLELFGAAEAARLFHSRSSHRTANLRMELDAALQRAFWGREAACTGDDAARAMLVALAPRDRLRFLGLLAGTLFKKTFDGASRVQDMAVRAGLGRLAECTRLLNYGSEAEGYVEPDVLEVIKSVTLDLPRAIKHTYTNINSVVVLVAAVALGVHALLAEGGPAAVTCLDGGAARLPALAEELHKALRAIVAQSGERLATHQLTRGSVFDLVHAHMAVSALAAAAAAS